MGDRELDRFKADINLIELASFYGYECIQKESSRSSIVMMHPGDGDKIVCVTGLDGHSIFFSVRQSCGGGSVIDFVMHREGVGLGGARQVLRKCLIPRYLQSRSRVHYRPEAVLQNGPDLYARWLGMSAYQAGYLEMRGLSVETIAVFADRLRSDERGNVAFRHDGLRCFAGWELKNRGFTGFSKYGKKGLFGCKIDVPEKTSIPLLVVAESAIDVMSYYQLKPRRGLYVSFAGALSYEQLEVLSWVVNHCDRAIIATDNDLEGEKYMGQIRLMRDDVERDCPPVGKDWNDTLNNREARQIGEV